MSFLVNSFVYGGPPIYSNQYSMLFDGVDESININTPSFFPNAEAFTISVWSKSSSYSGLYGFITFYTASTDRILFYATAGTIRLYINQAYAFWTITGINNIWSNLVFVFDGSQPTNLTKVKLYVNGVQVSMTMGSATPYPSSLNATSSYVDNNISRYLTQHFQGYLDEVSIFDYPLIQSDIDLLYNSGTPSDLNNTVGLNAPVHWWRMGDGDTWDGTNFIINDVGTTGGNNGTSVNMEEVDRVTDVP